MFEQLAKRFVQGYPNTKDPQVQNRLILFSSTLGIVLNLILVITKIAVGVLVNSLAIISDGINNLSDTISSLVAALGSILSQRPSDNEHPFGHGRYEYVASFVISFIIMYIAIELFRRGVALVMNPEPLFLNTAATLVLLFSIAVKMWMYRYNMKIHKSITSTINEGIAKDAQNDVLATAGVLISLILYMAFEINIDGIASIMIAGFVFKNGLELMRDTLDNLIGQKPDEELVETIDKLIMDGKYVRGYHKLIVHDYGRGNLFASAHVEIPANLSVEEIHESIDLIEAKVLEKTHVNLVLHMDPEYVYEENPSEDAAH